MESETNDKVIPDGHTIVELENGGWYSVSSEVLAQRAESERLLQEGYLRCKAAAEKNIASIDAAMNEVMAEENANELISELQVARAVQLENLANIKLQYGIKD